MVNPSSLKYLSWKMLSTIIPDFVHNYKKNELRILLLLFCLRPQRDKTHIQEGPAPVCEASIFLVIVIVVIVIGGKQSQIMICRLRPKSYLVVFAQNRSL